MNSFGCHKQNMSWNSEVTFQPHLIEHKQQILRMVTLEPNSLSNYRNNWTADWTLFSNYTLNDLNI